MSDEEDRQRDLPPPVLTDPIALRLASLVIQQWHDDSPAVRCSHANNVPPPPRVSVLTRTSTNRTRLPCWQSVVGRASMNSRCTWHTLSTLTPLSAMTVPDHKPVPVPLLRSKRTCSSSCNTTMSSAIAWWITCPYRQMTRMHKRCSHLCMRLTLLPRFLGSGAQCGIIAVCTHMVW